MKEQISRREFLKRGAAVVASAVIPGIPEFPFAQLKELDFYPAATRALYYNGLLVELNDYLRRNPDSLPAINEDSIKNWIDETRTPVCQRRIC